jgi:hypothetical protein
MEEAVKKERVAEVTRALLGPYVGMEFTLRNANLIAMRKYERRRCVVTFVGHDERSGRVDMIPGNHEFYFRFCDAREAGKHPHGWWCWDDRCWRTE